MKGDLTRGIAIGIGAAVVARLANSMLSGAGRFLACAAFKSVILLFDKAHETVAKPGEVFDDLVAEARAELRVQRNAAQRGRRGSDNAQASTVSCRSGMWLTLVQQSCQLIQAVAS